MKHSLKITIILLIIFLLTQYIGLAIVYKYIDIPQTQAAGKTVFVELPVGERPPLEEKTSFVPIMITILIGTVILLLLIKYNLTLVWKVWFLIAITMALTIAAGSILKPSYAFALASILAIWKVFKPNFYIHNFTELFIYGGIAAIFVPVFNVLSISILLILISIYDAYAVWKSKHMVTLATSQAQHNAFAGLCIPYSASATMKAATARSATLTSNTKSVPVQTAILGGGDIAFPLLFAGVLLKEWGLFASLVIPIFAALGLAYIFFKGKPHHFYPAMPFISAGCFMGLGITWILVYFL